MTKLQIELAKAKKRIEKAVHKKIDCHRITICYSAWDITVHAWCTDSDIIATWYIPKHYTTKQVVSYIQHNED